MKYRKKPVEVEAIQWNGENNREIYEFCEGYADFNENGLLFITTLEGSMMALKNDYIIRGVNGEFYPCKEDIFNKTYERLDGMI